MNLETTQTIPLPGKNPFEAQASTVLHRPPAPVRVRRHFEPLEKALLPIDQAVIARRYVDELLDAETVEKIEAALADVQAQRKVAERHSPVLAAERERELKKIYDDAPTKENLKNLREAKTLSFWDHASAQNAAQGRLAEIVRAQIAPLMPELYTKTATLLEADGKYCEISDSHFYKNFGLTAPVHPVAQSLRANAALFKRLASYAGNSPELPGFLEYLLAAHKDTSRKPVDLRCIKLFMPRRVTEDTPDAAPEDTASEPGKPGAVEVGAVAVE
ncbi:MAG: hypothetical protein ACLQAH_16770 [Limisphaerales bacterium]